VGDKQSAQDNVTRRNLIAGLGAAAAGAAVVPQALAKPKHDSGQNEHDAWHGTVDAWIAKQQIAELRRSYALATDLIGLNTEDSVAQGRAVYRRIFTPDARIGATGQEPTVGPDAWVKVANDALKIYQDTQHLIGTQVVDLTALPDADGQGGAATMTSYLQAWHAKADGELWLFIGTYYDKLSYTPEAGWQIYDMMLQQVSGDTRQINN
jgi:hypothetical protein